MIVVLLSTLPWEKRIVPLTPRWLNVASRERAPEAGEGEGKEG